MQVYEDKAWWPVLRGSTFPATLAYSTEVMDGACNKTTKLLLSNIQSRKRSTLNHISQTVEQQQHILIH